EPFDLVQPGTAGGGEMEVESLALLRLQPALHLGALMGAVVVHNEMDFLILGKLLFEMIQELHELPTAVALPASADDFAVQNVEGSEQSRGAIAFVIVRLTFRQARPQRKNRRGAIQRLDLTLFVHTQYQGTVRRIQIETNDIPHLFLKARIAGEFEPLHPMRPHIVALPDPVHDSPRYTK